MTVITPSLSDDSNVCPLSSDICYMAMQAWAKQNAEAEEITKGLEIRQGSQTEYESCACLSQFFVLIITFYGCWIDF